MRRYPSIIQEYNLCFTTVKRDNLTVDAESGETPMADVPDSGIAEGILPKVVRQLVQRRRQVKVDLRVLVDLYAFDGRTLLNVHRAQWQSPKRDTTSVNASETTQGRNCD